MTKHKIWLIMVH